MSAFLFPGQGSQTPGMGKFLVENFAIARQTFEEASDSLDLDLKKLCFEASESELSLTENTQPALLCVSTATARVISQDLGISPQVAAGHSIGEYAAFVQAQVLNFSDAMKAVRKRGQAMQSAVPIGQGGMLATLGLNEIQVEFLCRWAEQGSSSTPLSPANFNCDGQIVISGNLKALNWLRENFKSDSLPAAFPGEARRVKLIPLQVSAPFHCAMMKPAEDAMRDFFASVSFANAKLKIIQNVHAQVETSSAVLKENLIRQVSAPVKWTQSMIRLKELGVSTCFETGNGSVLKGLLKKIDGEFFKVYSTSSLDDLKAIESLST